MTVLILRYTCHGKLKNADEYNNVLEAHLESQQHIKNGTWLNLKFYQGHGKDYDLLNDYCSIEIDKYDDIKLREGN